MGADLNQIEVLTRREIEARIAGPIIRAFSEEFGAERTVEIVRKVVVSLARESGEFLKTVAGGDSLEDFGRCLPLWTRGEALRFEVLEQGAKKVSLNVTRCRYAEMYRELGMEDLGSVLSCARDFALVEGFNPRITLTRTRTIMEGGDCCDFRFEIK